MLISSGVALPLITNLRDCSSYSLTVAPYWSQLQDLPARILAAGFNQSQLLDVYLSTNPLITAIAIALFLSPIFLVVSEINKNYSQVDRLWSILPTFWIAHYVAWAHLAGLPTTRLNTVLAVYLLWTVRLTFNYWRKGGYSIGSEDYRWELLRAKIPPALFFVFNVLFISLAQSLLLCAITTPVYVLTLASRLDGDVMHGSDYIFSRGLMILVVVEFFADGQQWNYQSAKKTYQSTGKVPPKYRKEDLDRGFITSGLWAWSRHPNFAAEQTIWVILYQWSCYASFVYLNWTFVGALGYLILFQASTWFTELVTAGKYAEYKEYQKRVSKFIPKLATLSTGPVPVTDSSASKQTSQPPGHRNEKGSL